MNGVFDNLPDEFRNIITSLLAERHPELLAALQMREKPTIDQQESVIDVVAVAFSEHLGPGHEPTARGVLIDQALGPSWHSGLPNCSVKSKSVPLLTRQLK